MSRYDQLNQIIAYLKPQTIVEVGTWNGLRALQMAEEALKHQGKVHYIGFDLFEVATAETDARELNVKKHFSVEQVSKILDSFQEKFPGFSYELVEGDTRETLPGYLLPLNSVDLAFIDGGHSIETIRSDYRALEGAAKVIVFDDYYEGRDTELHGANKVLEEIGDYVVLPKKDPVMGGGTVQMALTPRSAVPIKQNLIVKTKNCVPDENIQANIRYSTPLIKSWALRCRSHGLTAVIVSAGPTFKDHFKEIKKLSKRKDVRLFCVKHSHDWLISKGVVPYGCLLLDPRSHVQDFIETPHPDVTYFAASMVHPTTIDRLLERGANVVGYHALVGAGEQDVLKQMGGTHMLIGGGSTSAMRGVNVLHCIGFRKFRLYGFDSCYQEKPESTKQQYVHVEINGRSFHSDVELVAQAQDFDRLLQHPDTLDMEIEVIGDGMIPWIFKSVQRNAPRFEELYGSNRNPAGGRGSLHPPRAA